MAEWFCGVAASDCRECVKASIVYYIMRDLIFLNFP